LKDEYQFLSIAAVRMWLRRHRMLCCGVADNRSRISAMSSGKCVGW
jgi:hypothetical protein